jgi:hypothetical protein
MVQRDYAPTELEQVPRAAVSEVHRREVTLLTSKDVVRREKGDRERTKFLSIYLWSR